MLLRRLPTGQQGSRSSGDGQDEMLLDLEPGAWCWGDATHWVVQLGLAVDPQGAGQPEGCRAWRWADARRYVERPGSCRAGGSARPILPLRSMAWTRKSRRRSRSAGWLQGLASADAGRCVGRRVEMRCSFVPEMARGYLFSVRSLDDDSGTERQGGRMAAGPGAGQVHGGALAGECQYTVRSHRRRCWTTSSRFAAWTRRATRRCRAAGWQPDLALGGCT